MKTYCKSCLRTSDVVDMSDCPFCREKLIVYPQSKLRTMLVDIYNCASAWDNDDGKMAEANEKTPEDIFAKYLKEIQEMQREKILDEINYKEKRDDVNVGGGQYGHPETDFNTGYNQALQDIKKVLV
jgi:hypothetical protein